jgi:hypothetical protein
MFKGIGWIIIASVAGTILLWCKEGPGKRRVYSLSELVDRLPLAENVRYTIQFFVFVILGTFIALLLTEPSDGKQAFAAGLGWTAGLSTTSAKRQ